MNNFKHIISITIIASLTLIVSCKKDKSMDDHDHDHSHGSSDGTGAIALQASFNVNGAVYNADSVYQDGFGNDYKINFVRVYLSQLQFTDHDSTLTNLPNNYLLLEPTTSTYALGSLPTGHYHDFLFNVGIDSATNHSDPNAYAPTSPLYPQSPSMHWTWNSGYIFYKLEGVADTNMDGTFETNFSYHVGTDNMKRAITETVHKDVVKDQTTDVNVAVNLGQFLNNVNLDTEFKTHTMDNMPLATKIANNSSTAFSIN